VAGGRSGVPPIAPRYATPFLPPGFTHDRCRCRLNAVTCNNGVAYRGSDRRHARFATPPLGHRWTISTRTFHFFRRFAQFEQRRVEVAWLDAAVRP